MIRYIALLTATMLLTVSCSGASGMDTAQVAPPNPTATVMPSVPTPTQVTPRPTPTHTATALPPTPTVTPVRVQPIPTFTPKPTATPMPTLYWDLSCDSVAVKTEYVIYGSKLKWTFDSNPNLTAMSLRTSPSQHPSKTDGFGLMSFRQFKVAVTNSLSYEYELINPSGYQLAIDVELVTEHKGGATCVSKMYKPLSYPEESQVIKDLVIPAGLTIDYDKYSDIVIPAPTLESLIQAFAKYDSVVHGDGQPDYDMWRITGAQEDRIRDYDPKLRVYLFGDGADAGDWQTVRLILEIINAIKPSLEPRFAATIDEVSLPQFHTFCEAWMDSLDYNKHCNMNGNAALFSDGPIKQGSSGSRGYNWYQSIMAQEYAGKDLYKYDHGDSVSNPCCSINFHEIGHGFGLEHTYCAHSSVSRWADRSYMTKIWNQDDLAAIAVHLDPRTKTGMNIHEAAAALGIEKDSRYHDLIEKPWLACGNQASGWDKLAERIYEEYVNSGYVETQHPDNRNSVQFAR